MARKKPQPQQSPPAATDDGRPESTREDANLIVRFREGDREAFDELWRRYSGAVFNFILRMVGNRFDAEELMQDTFVRVLRAAANYQPRAKALTWILQISRNLCLDHFKRSALRQHQSLDHEAGAGAGGATVGDLMADERVAAPHEPLLDKEERHLLEEGINRLSEKKREALVLRLWHELPYDDIAEIVGSPSGTVKYRVHEAIKDLREMLEKTPNFRPA